MNDNPYPWLQDFINQVPDILQPLIVAAAGAIPYVEGEGAAVLGIIAGINPIVAAIAGAAGNILAVLAVVLIGSRIRGGVVAGHAARTESRMTASAPVGLEAAPASAPHTNTATMNRRPTHGRAERKPDAPFEGPRETRPLDGEVRCSRSEHPRATRPSHDADGGVLRRVRRSQGVGHPVASRGDHPVDRRHGGCRHGTARTPRLVTSATAALPQGGGRGFVGNRSIAGPASAGQSR